MKIAQEEMKVGQRKIRNELIVGNMEEKANMSVKMDFERLKTNESSARGHTRSM